MLAKILRFVSLMAVMALALAGLRTSSASADSGAATYEFVIGQGAACGAAPSPCPTVTTSAPGELLEFNGGGTLSIHPGSVTGGGDATHHFAAGGQITGTWRARQLLSFTEYGCELPSNYCGGQAVIRIEIWIGDFHALDGTLKVESRRGAYPAGAIEGIRFAAQGRNFNQIVSGSTLFIKQP